MVTLKDIPTELARQHQLLQGTDATPLNRARMSNLIIYCGTPAQAEALSADVGELLANHPARVILLVADPTPADPEVTADVNVTGHPLSGDRMLFAEQVTLTAHGTQAIDRLPYSVRGLLVGDVPTNLWWAVTQPPALAGPLLYELAEHAEQVIYDSIGWPEPGQGVAATANWLVKFERTERGRWRSAADLNWRRLKYWRRLFAQALSPASAPGVLTNITEMLVEHGPHAVVQAWELVSWLASRCGWRVQAGKLSPGVEFAWQVQAPHGSLRVRIRRLADGPSEIRMVRIAWNKNGVPGALQLAAENQTHLSVVPERSDTAPRTMAVQSQNLAELVARQLSDRDRDPVFRESMAVAQVFAQSVKL
jgi:glucose-6-phosphate dehydrogenase assembly protein OpcA